MHSTGATCQTNRPARLQRAPRAVTRVRAATQAQPAIRDDQDTLVRLARAFVNTPMLFQAAVTAGRYVIRNTADSKGIAWTQHVQQLEAQLPLLESLKAELEDPSLSPPAYYLAPIHGYEESNLCWQAAMEQEPARQVVAAREYPHLAARQAAALLADNTMGTLRAFWTATRPAAAPGLLALLQRLTGGSGDGSVRSIVDLGCCDGIATQYLSDAFPQAAIVGVDLSPHYLAVAELRRRERAASSAASSAGASASASASASAITYRHGLAEDTGLPSGSADVVTIQYVFHECPRDASRAILREAHRLLRPGGVVFVSDTDSNSAALQKLHPAIFLLREQSEPWMFEFRQLSVPDGLAEAGFTSVQTKAISERDISWAGLKA